MIRSTKIVFLTLLLITCAQCKSKDDNSTQSHPDEAAQSDGNEISKNQSPISQSHESRNHKYSSKIVGNKRTSNEHVFGIRTFPFNKVNFSEEVIKKKVKISSPKEKVLDFRIQKTENHKKQNSVMLKDDKDLVIASAGGGKQKKLADDEEEKTLAQQVADGKYGLIQNEIFANGSKRPGILSYRANNEVPKDTKDNLGGLEKDEIWLAEDHILVLRGGNYQNAKENEKPLPVWPPIDNYKAPHRQVKIPKNPEVPPPFPVQLTEDGPVEFLKGVNNPFLPPFVPPPPAFAGEFNKTFPFPVPPYPPPTGNKSLPFPVPPHLFPPFLNNLPPGATFVAPPENRTDFDEDDPSIYYPPKYDFVYPRDNTTAVPPGPLVPGIILPPPPDFFSLLENDTDSLTDNHNETDDSINSITPNTYVGPKYLPALRKPSRNRISGNRNVKRPTTSTAKVNDTVNIIESPKPGKPSVTYVYPENSKKLTTPVTYNSFRTSVKVPQDKYPNGFHSPIFVPSNPGGPLYLPLPTTSPKPNHITLPTTSLPKQIFIITTPHTMDKNHIQDAYKMGKPVEPPKYEHMIPEVHPLRSLIKPNVTVSYNGKYGHLPPPTSFTQSKPESDIKIIRGHYVTQPPFTKGSKVPSTDVNSITVTPIPVVKKVRIQSATEAKPEVNTQPNKPSKATLYFYEETSTKTPQPEEKPEKTIESPTKTATGSVSKPDVSVSTPYYYSTHSTNKTPIRQFLEETFHSSNVLTRKPQINQVHNAEIITHNGYSDIPKMKHLNYATPISSPRPVVKYHYVTESSPIVIPTPKIKSLEIKNSGSTGLQTVHLDGVSGTPAAKPIIVDPYVAPAQKPEPDLQSPISPLIVTHKTPDFNNNEGPFIPSSYYATVRPDHIHFTSQEQTLVDDLTKNYFTIFGQKINSPATTPLAPVKTKTKANEESGLTYISENGHDFKIQQVHDGSSGNQPSKSTVSFSPREKSKDSNFEKYLKELTGEDQRDYIVSGVFPFKIKKGKTFFTERIPSHIFSQNPIIYPDNPSVGSNFQYQPILSTTLRPVIDVEIKPQYLQHISSTSKPLHLQQQQIQPQNVNYDNAFQHYIQEITDLTSPTTKRPVKVKKPDSEYPSNIQPPIPFHSSEGGKKPITLADDILINYKEPRPTVEAAAEVIGLRNSFDNIKIVDPPNLSPNANNPYSSKQEPFDVDKQFLKNIAKPQFFTQTNQNGGNSFVSYKLPGNGGHFYFLTPQIVEKENKADNQRQERGYRRMNRSNDRKLKSIGAKPDDYSSEKENNVNNGYSNHDYLRRRRKKS